MMDRAAQRSAQRARALADLAHLLREMGSELITLLIVALPLALRGACLAVAVGGAAWSFLSVWTAFGADGLALIPTGALLLTPLAFVLAGGFSWAGLLVGGAIDLMLGLLAPIMSPVVLNLFCVAIIGGAVFSEIYEQQKKDGNSK